jgi:hypothetical protein
MNDGPQPHITQKTASEARQAVTTGRVRWILAISLVGAVVAMGIAYWVA